MKPEKGPTNVFREDGFTLAEMMVTIMIMTITLFALYSIFDMSMRVFSFGNDKVEATENARVALERMEREIRAAYPYNPPSDTKVLDVTNAGFGGGLATDSDQITFFNEITNDGKGNAADERISFYVDGGNLVRKQGANAQTLAPLGANGLLEFKYFDKATGAEIANPSTTNVNNIGMVRIKLVVDQDGRKQQLITNAALRNKPCGTGEAGCLSGS